MIMCYSMEYKTKIWCKVRILLFVFVLVFLHNTDSVDLPHFVGPGSNVTVVVGRDAVLKCKVNSLHNYKVAWLRVDTQTILSIGAHVITKNPRVVAASEDAGSGWTLTLRAAQPGDAGRYMCQLNTEPMMMQHHHLTVVVPPDIDDADSSSEVSVREGEDAALRCQATGLPTPTISWRREDHTHFRIDNHTLVSRWSGGWLNLTDVERGTAGVYLCIATNGVPPSPSKRLLLQVMFAPVVRASRPSVGTMSGSVMSVGAMSGGAASLVCAVDAHPPPRLYFTRERDQPLLNDSLHVVSVTRRGHHYTLAVTVSQLSAADAGLYRCHADNVLGKADADIVLNLLITTTTTTTTTTTSTTTTTEPPTTTTLAISPTATVEMLDDVVMGDPYIVLSQHQMQTTESSTS